MPSTFRSLRTPRLMLAAAACALLPAGTPALAQKTVESRVEKLEKEMQAVQRKVFPGGAGQVVSPELSPEATPAQQAGSPATPPLTDLTARVGAIESQLTRLTGQVEEDGNRLRLLEEANKGLMAQIQALQAQAAAAQAAAAAAAAPSEPPPALVPAAAPTRTTAATRAAAAKAPPAPKADTAAQARMQAVAAVERPSTGNAAQDGYTYGFRLWTAKFYPEAATQLEDVLAKFGNDPIASRTANLLGRAYLEDNKPTQAAKTLFENYRARPKGDRAAESLAWTGEALIKLNRPKDACLAYDELSEAFGSSMPANVRDMMTKGRARAKCGG